MESKVNEAAQRKRCGYNCAQAVACTYCKLCCKPYHADYYLEM